MVLLGTKGQCLLETHTNSHRAVAVPLSLTRVMVSWESRQNKRQAEGAPATPTEEKAM